MHSNGWFAKMADSDLGKFPERIAEVISGFRVFRGKGWGKGFSGRHLTKLIGRDESIFTTTWAELRQKYFQGLIPKMVPGLRSMRVPLPCYSDGRILSDKEIREKVKAGYRLMFCPITQAKEFNGSSLISIGQLRSIKDIVALKYEEDWLSEIDRNSRMVKKPYWFWIDCAEGGSAFYSKMMEHKFPTLIEYLITAFVFKEEMAKPLDKDIFIWLHHYCTDTKHIIVGGNPAERLYYSKVIDLGRVYEGPIYSDNLTFKKPMMARFIEVV